MIYCSCCVNGFPQSMAAPVPANPGCSVLNSSASGITNCQTHPMSGGPNIDPCKPGPGEPTDPIDIGITRPMGLGDIKKAIKEMINKKQLKPKGGCGCGKK